MVFVWPSWNVGRMPEDGGDVEIEEFTPDQTFLHSQNLTPKQRYAFVSRGIYEPKPWLYYPKLSDFDFRLPGSRVSDFGFDGLRISIFKVLKLLFSL